MKRSSLIILAFGVVLGTAIGLLLNPLVKSEGHLQAAPWLEIAHRVCTAIGGLGTFVTLIIVVRQFRLLRNQSELVQKNIVTSMESQLYARLDSFNRFVFEHFQEYDLLDIPFPQQVSSDQRSKLHRMCELGYTFFEEIFKHHMRLKLEESEDWDEWEQNLIHFFRKSYVRGYWKTVSTRYAKSFQTLANDLVVKMEREEAVAK
ncbi:hypothetical protein [Zavarzinella formosa]|uniref:hypothetical protein n=1 Tax=Zavarzinella formosa TaxID=360055 RepID=UPI000308DB2E|nr:hypothetical protein [Zavarzinella formosa]